MKKNIILVGKDGRPSMRKVYSQMNTGELFVRRKLPRKQYMRAYSNNNGENYQKQKLDTFSLEDSITIRWGNRIDFPTNNGTIVYNKSENIEKGTNKKLSRELLLRNNVSCPLLYTPDSQNTTYPIIARPSVHAKGKNFIVLKNREDFVNHYRRNSPNGWYYSQYIDKEREFRVHVAHSKILGIMEKPRVEGQMAWNRAINHQAFTRVLQQDYILDVCVQAAKATQVLGLDFAGVDVIFKDGKAYILELNTSPTLNSSEYISEQYAKYFQWLFRQNTRREHWDFSQWKKASSFAWKQDQLNN